MKIFNELPFVRRQVKDRNSIVEVASHGVAVECVFRRPAYRRVVHVRGHQHSEPLSVTPKIKYGLFNLQGRR